MIYIRDPIMYMIMFVSFADYYIGQTYNIIIVFFYGFKFVGRKFIVSNTKNN